ncbi:ionotropic receptor 75a-like [Anopheles ziemanni]|uniref:ionotropic receptor 75a-like n=1 Tax=Anopheles coustani TaxID=139045 RepID=UPI0026598649|nr:ionotropic receptor 75a-like [Anopheles coustani]XP_058174457.1 ionotropic receptor 75a-like [Anopheles ziemanni]
MYCERYKTGAIYNLECSGTEAVLNRLSEKAYFNDSFEWLVFGGQNMELATSLLSQQNINYDTKMLLVFESVEHERQREHRYEFYDVSATLKRRGGKVIFTSLGFSTPDNILPTIVPQKPDLKGIVLWTVVSTINQHQPHPFIENLESDNLTKSYFAHIYTYRLVKLLQMMLKFKIKIILAADWRFDVIGKNSSIGVVGQLQKKKVDFSMTPFSVLTERIPVCDFTIEIAKGKFYTIFRHPKSLNNSNIFLLPFVKMLWIAVAVILISVILILALSATCNHRLERTSYNDLIIDQSLLGTIAMLCQQGFHGSTTVCSKKVLIIVMMGFSFLLVQFYSTFIVGYQLISPPKTINTLEKLVDSSVKMAVENYSFQHDFFARTANPAALKLYNEKIAPNKYGFVNLTFGIQLVKGGGYAFHCDTAYGYKQVLEIFTEQQICELQEVELYPQRPVHVPMVKGSPLRELFKLKLQLLKEYGIIAYHFTKTFSSKPKCIKNSNKVDAIHLTDARFAFILLGTGIAASIVILALELVYVRLRRWYYFRSLVIPDNFVWLD